jgi:ABC-type multidrug transport system ATPase subunit
VVCSIHQPRSSIFGMFDDLMLLSEGHCVYFGPAEGVLDYFEQVSDGSRPSTQSHGQSNRLGSWIRCTARLRILCLMSCA